uniref:Intron-binding protein aquarius N-terminal domain-containing protein n=1 Tax=Ditylenchus dipsaci TaxID=166011 RepID=A0A915EKC2_9BILA
MQSRDGRRFKDFPCSFRLQSVSTGHGNGGKDMEIYFSFNLLVRRDPKANNFKAVLATIRQLLNTECVVPEWLHDLVLGYGEPNVAHYSRMNNTVATVNFNDTFLSYEHLLASFPGKKVVCGEQKPQPPFKLTFNEFVPQHDVQEKQRDISILVECEKKNELLFAASQEECRQNAISFTPAQVEAIKSGMQPGLTIVVDLQGQERRMLLFRSSRIYITIGRSRER